MSRWYDPTCPRYGIPLLFILFPIGNTVGAFIYFTFRYSDTRWPFKVYPTFVFPLRRSNSYEPRFVGSDNSDICQTLDLPQLVDSRDLPLPYTLDSDASQDKYQYTRKLSEHSSGATIGSNSDSWYVLFIVLFVSYLLVYFGSIWFRFRLF